MEDASGRSYLKYIAGLLLFGSNGIIASNIALSSSEIVLTRTLIGSAFLIVLFALSHGKLAFPHHPKQTCYLALSGTAMGASWIFLFEAYRLIGVGMASLAYYCGPIIVMALSPILFGERLTWPRLVGFMTVLGGVALVDGQALQAGGNVAGLACGLLSAVMFAIMVIFNKKATAIVGLENSMLQLTSAFIVVAVYVGLREGFAFQIGATDWLPILMLGLVNTGVGCYLYFSSIGHLPVQTVSVLGYLEPLSAVILSVLVLQEGMSPLQALGAAFIIGGAIFAEGVKTHRSRVALEGAQTRDNGTRVSPTSRPHAYPLQGHTR